ncbi:MAG: DUF3857 and transglutaminase domain-containing protein [Planctomycetota bacterium]
MTRKAVFTASVVALVLLGAGVAQALAGPPLPAKEEEIKEMISAAGDAKAYNEASVVYVLDEADVYVQDSGLATTESCQVIKLLTDAGVRANSVLRYEFDPATNRVTYKSIRIHRKDGQVEDVPVSSIIQQPARQHMIYWGNQQYLLQMPRLRIGDTLEIRISKTGFNIAYLRDAEGAAGGGAAGGKDGEETLVPPMPGHWYESTEWQGDLPVLKRRYSVHMPKDKPVQFEVYNGSLRSSLWFTEDAHVYTWEAEDVKPIKREPHMIATSDVVTKLVMATVPDWEMKSRWFHAANEGQFEADDAIREKVAEITAGLEDDEAKIVACLHWVADNIRYYGTSRGPCEGFTLHKGTETFRDKGGVCKDIAGMLITMLRVLGHEVYPSLTMAGSRVEAIPADQFNHTITVMRKKDGTFRILDPTWSPHSRETWSSWEALQGLVYGTPEGQPLCLSPFFPPEYSKLTARSDGEIREDGTLSTRIVIDASGSPGTSFRRTVGRTPVPQQRPLFEETAAVAPNAALEELAHTDPLDYSRDSQIDVQMSAADYVAGEGDLRMFRLPLMARPFGSWILSDLTYDVSAKERKFGMRLRATRLLVFEGELKLPAGWKVEKVPEPEEMDSGSATLSFKATPEDGVLKYRFELTVKHNIIPASDYVEYKKAIDTMNKLKDEWIVCSVG